MPMAAWAPKTCSVSPPASTVWAGVVDYVVKIIERDLLPKYPNVDGVVGLNHLYGCAWRLTHRRQLYLSVPFTIFR